MPRGAERRSSGSVADGLAQRLAQLIRHGGLIPVSRFMAEANAHYYAMRDPFGVAGDFTTAPEISQMFGELIGLWCGAVWLALGRPANFVLAELGPGRGTLMADALRAAKVVPGFREAASLHLVESSPLLRERQRGALSAFRPTWHETIGTLPDGPLILVANEFFDALPIYQFVRGARGWHECLIGLAPDGTFQFVAAPDGFSEPPGRVSAASDLPEGAFVEVCPAAEAIVDALAQRIVHSRGAALIIDYGSAEPRAAAAHGTLQAVRGHRYHAPLATPGEADLTAHVDFRALKQIVEAAGARALGPVAQGVLLRRLGIEQRATALSAKATAEQSATLAAARRRLTDDDAMGTLFQALAIVDPISPTPPGFES